MRNLTDVNVITRHVPVLVKEVVEIFHPVSGDYLLDATVGTGGHSHAFLEATNPGGHVVGLDADPLALQEAGRYLSPYGDRVTLIAGNFASLKDSLTGGGIVFSTGGMFSQILFDLGVGSHQLNDEARTFSFSSQAQLAMRYGLPKKLPLSQLQSINYLTAKLGYYPDVPDLLRHLHKEELAELIRLYGQEKMANRIARAIKKSPLLQTGAGLAQAIKAAVPGHYERGRINPATRTWQALRIAVNRELECLSYALPQAAAMLMPGGILAVISFHSLEDRIVKSFFKTSGLEILTAKPVAAGLAEVKQNPRSRSAKLRAARLN